MMLEERPQNAPQSYSIGPVSSVQHRWQDPGSHLHPPLLAQQRDMKELLQMERLRDRQVWEVPAPGVGSRSQCFTSLQGSPAHCTVPGIRAHRAQPQRRGQGPKVGCVPKWQYSQQPVTHLSLGKHNCVQKSMFFKGITQVFLSEVLTEVLSMLRTGLPNGKCPHGGF